MHSPDPPPPPNPSVLMTLLHGLVFLLTMVLRGLYLVGIALASALICIRRAIVAFEADPSFWIALSDLRRGASDTAGSLWAVGRSFIESFREAPNGRTSTPIPAAGGEDVTPIQQAGCTSKQKIPSSNASMGSTSSNTAPGISNRREPTRSRAGNTYYAVIVGRIPGVYGGWHLAGPQVTGIAEAIYSGFRTREEAEAAFAEALAAGYIRAISECYGI